MILQELLRNYILYREVLRPLIKSWSASLTTVYPRHLSLITSQKASVASNLNLNVSDQASETRFNTSISESISLTKMTGTHTITSHEEYVMTEYELLYKLKNKNISALTGNRVHIVLRNDSSSELAAKTRKTRSQSLLSSIDNLNQKISKTVSATTGYESKQLNTFLSLETHEKREYLGEFSLTHEETPLLLISKEGGEYHDIDQKSVGAII
jgi:hypothetical protein